MKNGFLKYSILILIVAFGLTLLAGCTSSNITVSSPIISTDRAVPGVPITIAVNALNNGEETDFDADLKINDASVETKKIHILAGETKTIEFQYTPTALGSCKADINGQTISFEVVKALRPANFVVGSLTVTPESPVAGQEFQASTSITNDGELPGTYKVSLKVNGQEISTREITLEAGKSTTEKAGYTPTTNGMYQMEFNGVNRAVKVLKGAEFKATSLKVSPTSAITGEEANVEAVVTNVGEAAGTLPVVMLVNGSESGSKPVTLEPGATATVNFNFTPQTTGINNISVGGQSAALMVNSLNKFVNPTFFYSISYPQDYTVESTEAATVAIEKAGIGGLSILVDFVSTASIPSAYFDSVAQGKKNQLPDWTYTNRTDFLENGQPVGYRYDYTNTVSGQKWIGKGLVVKKGGLGFYAVFTTIESEWDKNKSIGEACLKSLVTPVVATGTYANPGIGAAMVLPAEWSLLESGKTETPAVIFSPYNQPLALGVMTVESVPAGTTAQQYIDASTRNLTNQGFQAGQKNTFTFDNAAAGYEAYMTNSSADIKIRLVSAINSTRAYSIMFYGQSSAVDSLATTITQICKSLVLSTPTVAGVNKNESLFLLAGEIPTLDPAKTEDAPGDIAGALFSGLVKINTELKVVPDLAEGWVVSGDGKVYTFSLRKNAKFHDGKPVTAADVKYSWERACNPATQSAKAGYFLNDIVGAKDELAGKAAGISGVKVIDDYTLEVTIDAPKVYFLGKLAQPVTYIVDKTNVAKGSAWFETPNGTGPFKLKEWKKDSQLVLERNDTYYGTAAKLKNIVFKLFAGNSMQLYENGEIDLTGVSTTNLDKALDPANPLNKDLLTGSSLNFSYLGFNVGKAPFDDPKVRQAFALALDVPKVVDVALKGKSVLAGGYLPEKIPGFNAALQPSTLDVAKAKQLISESKYGSIDKMPAITLKVLYASTPTTDAIIGMLQQNLGVQIKIETVSEYETYFKSMRNHDFQLCVSGWNADYVDPQNFLDVLFQSQSSENIFAYSNPAVDSALAQAAGETDEAKRLSQYQNIEKQILGDLPAAPLYRNTKSYVLVKPYVKGYVMTPLNVNEWCDISVVAH